MKPVQLYETSIHNEERRGQAFTFISVPARSLSRGVVPSLDELAEALGLMLMEPENPRAFRRNVRAWGLPFLIDGALGRREAFWFYFDPDTPFGEKYGPSAFSEYLAFQAPIPFESSPLGPRTLVSLVGATGTIGTGLGYAATGAPILLVIVPAGIVIGGAALGIGAGAAVGLAEALRYRIRKLMGVPEDPPPNISAPEDE